MGDVVSLGSINVDKIHHVSDAEITDLRTRYSWFPDRGQTVLTDDLPTDFSANPDSIRQGGKGANQAVAAAKAGAKTEMLGKVGPDGREFGVRSHLTEAGVGVTRTGTAPEPTGTAYVFVGQEGDNWIIVRPGANSAIDNVYIREQYDTILSAECLLLQNEIPIEPVMALLSELAAQRDRPTIILDPAPADGIEELLGCDAVDYLTPNQSEARILADADPDADESDEAIARELRALGVENVVMTLGADGALIVTDDGVERVAAPSVEVRDKTGAGDAFNGALAVALAEGQSVAEAVEFACAAGALATTKLEVIPGLPRRKQVEDLLPDS
jgi:ribokinase